MGYQIPQSSIVEPMQFLMILSADNKTGATGLSPVVTIAKNGAVFAAPLGAVTEIGEGWYSVAATAANYNTIGPLLLHAEAPTANDTDDRYDVIPVTGTTVVGTTPATGGGRPISANNLIRKALKHITVISGTEDPSADEAADAYEELNNMIDAWGTETLALSETPRPVFIRYASIISNANPLQPLELPLVIQNLRKFRQISVKNITSALPTKIYIDGAFPLRNVELWPIPNISSLELVSYPMVAVSEFSDRTTLFSFPPGYVDALCYNLAMRLAPMFNKTPSPIVAALATQSWERIQRVNENKDDLIVDAAIVSGASSGVFNWRTGDTGY